MIDARVGKRLGQFSLKAEISGGGVICVAGANGSGKTTLLRSIAGLTDSNGYVKVDEADVSSLPPERRGIVMVTPTSPMLHLDVDSHIAWGARLAGVGASKDRIDEAKSIMGIDFSGRLRRLSLGQRERVCLATALMSGRRVILVDEAFANLHEKSAFMRLYCELAKKAGADVVFSSLDNSDAQYADKMYLIEDGRTRQAS